MDVAIDGSDEFKEKDEAKQYGKMINGSVTWVVSSLDLHVRHELKVA